jgi:hypothetical protein
MTLSGSLFFCIKRQACYSVRRVLSVSLFCLCVCRGPSKKDSTVKDAFENEDLQNSASLTTGIKRVLGDRVKLKVHRIDTKRNKSEAFIKKLQNNPKR